jgi:YVTN family beta-propeller protein
MHRHSVSVIRTDNYNEIGVMEAMAYPYDIVVSADGKRAYVANVGASTVTAMDLEAVKTIGHVAVGKNPESLALTTDGKTLYVATTDSDSISMIDTATLKVKSTASLKEKDTDPAGMSPSGIVLSPDGTKLYVACAGDNKVEILNTADMTPAGSIPVGYIPSSVRVSPDGNYLYVTNMKGRPRPTTNSRSSHRRSKTIIMPRSTTTPRCAT